jgi:hypothetical protein
MKRQFEYKKGKTQLGWEIERKGLLLTQRSWGRNRPEIIRARGFRSEASAKRECEKDIEFQLSRGFVEIGAPAGKMKPRLLPQGPKAVLAAKRAIVSITIPALRALGFEGAFPNFRRIDEDRHSVVWFQWGRSSGSVTVGLGVVPPKSKTTTSQDLMRAINIRNRQRTTLRDLVPERDWKLFSFDLAAAKWGTKWPGPLASLLRAGLETSGMAWLADPARRPGRGK